MKFRGGSADHGGVGFARFARMRDMHVEQSPGFDDQRPSRPVSPTERRHTTQQ
jgi:hypothetical protein